MEDTIKSIVTTESGKQYVLIESNTIKISIEHDESDPVATVLPIDATKEQAIELAQLAETKVIDADTMREDMTMIPKSDTQAVKS